MATSLVQKVAPFSVDGEVLSGEAYARMEAEMLALPESEIRPVRLDIGSIIVKALAVGPVVNELMPQIEEELPTAKHDRIRAVQDSALALGTANGRYNAAIQPSADLQSAGEQGGQARDTVHADLEALIQHGILDRSVLNNCTWQNGYKNTANDLETMLQACRTNWDKIEGNCPLKLSDLDFLEKLITSIRRLAALRDLGPATAAKALDMRNRAYTLFLRNYSEAQRAVCFLRWDQGDADTLVPSLYAGRSHKVASGKEESDDQPATPETKETPAKEYAKPGMPGANPFTE